MIHTETYPGQSLTMLTYTGNKETIAKRFDDDDRERKAVLDRARLCAALTKPWLLPPGRRRKNDKLPQNYQAVGARGVNNLEGMMLLALYPPDSAWFELEASIRIRYDPDVPPEIQLQIEDELFRRELMIMALLESVSILSRTNRRQQAFRSNKRSAISQIIVTGDSLERMNPDFGITVFKRTGYVTNRDSSGNVNYHITRESIDPLALDPEIFAKTGLEQSKLEDKTARQRAIDLYTFPEWNPQSHKWVITQEINGKEVLVTEDPVSPFISTPFELAAGDDYGHGLVEQNIGDLKSLNTLNEKLLEFAATYSKQLWALDRDEMSTRTSDLAKPTGSVIRTEVRDGRATKIAMITAEHTPQFRMVQLHAVHLNAELGKAFLIESEIQPRQDRVTAQQVQRIALELEGALGGVYAPIAEQQQLQTLRRAMFQMGQQGIMPMVPEDLIEIRALTGISALRRESERAKLFNLPQFLQGLPPEATNRIDFNVLVQAAVRLSGLDVPGLVKSDEKMAQEAQERQAALAQEQAITKGIDVVGNVTENQLSSEAA